MIGWLRRLWTGALPLEQAFWTYAVIGGIAVNAVTSLGSLILFASDRILVGLLVGYGLSVPYNLLVIIGVWRSAMREGKPSKRADIYRAATLVGMVLLSVT